MFLSVPSTRDEYSRGFAGSGVKERVTPYNFPPRNSNGFGMRGLDGVEGWFDGIDWGEIIGSGVKTAGSIAVNQWGQPNLKPGQSIQRVKNPDGSYSEVLLQQPAGIPVGMGPAVTAGLTSGTLMALGLGAVVLFVVMQGRGR